MALRYAALALGLSLTCSAPGELGAEQRELSRTIARVASLDPVHAQSVAAARAVALVYETLLEYEYLSRPYKLRGGLAEALPEVSADGLTLTFRLRDDVYFGPAECFGRDAAGRPARRKLTAADAVYSLKRLADTKITTASYWILEDKIEGLAEFHESSRSPAPTDYDSDVPGLRALDERTLRLRLTGPAPQLLWGLAMPCTAIVPREAVEREGARFGQGEAGSGAFALVSWRRDYRMLFERRPGRDPARDNSPVMPGSEDAHPARRLRLLVMDDPSTRWLAFLKGELDMEGDIPSENRDAVFDAHGELSAAMSRRGVTLHRQPGLDCFYIGINMDDPLLGKNRKLRQALNAAFDFAAWESLNPGSMDPATGPVPPNVAGYLDAPFPYAYDLVKARRLLKEAGFENGVDPETGRRLELRLELGRVDRETRESTELLAALWSEIGVSLKAEFHNWPTFLERVGRREAQLFRVGWLADYPDAENFLQLFHSRNASPGPNRVNYDNPRFDKLYEEARATSDSELRDKLYMEMQAILREDCPWVFLYNSRSVALTHKRLRNFKMHDFPYGMEKHWRLAD